MTEYRIFDIKSNELQYGKADFVDEFTGYTDIKGNKIYVNDILRTSFAAVYYPSDVDAVENMKIDILITDSHEVELSDLTTPESTNVVNGVVVGNLYKGIGKHGKRI